MEAVTRRKSLNIVLNATKNVAVLYTIGFFLSLTGALTFLGAQIANAMTSGKFWWSASPEGRDPLNKGSFVLD